MLQKKRSRTLRSSLIQFGQDLLEGRRRGLFLLSLFSLCWRFVVFWKNRFYEWGLFSPHFVSRPIVSIGNVVAGGTGKTPLTLLLASSFSHRQVAILSRGSSLQGSLADEPLLLARRASFARVYLGKDRFLSAQKAIEEQADVLFLDDGFQYRRLFRDLDVVLLSKEKPFSNGRYLPCGFLRDSPKRLSQAAAICVNPIDSEEELSEWRKRFALPSPLIGVRLDVKRLIPDLPLQHVPVALFCGIAHPDSFRKTILRLGAIVVHEWILADHEGLSSSDLEKFALQAQSLGAKMLVCTEKDQVKLPLSDHLPLPLVYPEMELTITAGQEHWQNLVDKIEQKIDNYKTYGKRSKNFTP